MIDYAVHLVPLADLRLRGRGFESCPPAAAAVYQRQLGVTSLLGRYSGIASTHIPLPVPLVPCFGTTPSATAWSAEL